LPSDLPARRAESGSQTDLIAASGGPREQEVGNIGARDEKKKTGAHEKGEYDRLCAADCVAFQRDGIERTAGRVIFGKFGLDLRADRADFLLCLLERDVRAHTPYRSEVIKPPRLGGEVVPERDENVEI